VLVPPLKVPVWPLFPLMFQMPVLPLMVVLAPEKPLLVMLKAPRFSVPPLALAELPVLKLAPRVMLPLVRVVVVVTVTAPFRATFLPALSMVRFTGFRVPVTVASFTVPVRAKVPPVGENVPV
jgi:hypothetical protein